MRLFRLSFAIVGALGLLLALNVLVTLQPVRAAPADTIQSKIDAAPNGGTVNIAAGTYTESLTVNKTLTLTGVASNTTINKAVSGQRVITVTAGHDLRLENLTVTGSYLTGDAGGGIFIINGSLAVVNSRIANNQAIIGGGVFKSGADGRVDVVNSRIEFNTTLIEGGGFFVVGGVALTNTQLVSNTASGSGGGLAA